MINPATFPLTTEAVAWLSFVVGVCVGAVLVGLVVLMGEGG